ncbi:cytochrome c oxidase subunit 8B, mitochondrial [Conger conger]|nr:cytochrome c oxidase subunit 8B, mitochondrial [Conger conger]
MSGFNRSFNLLRTTLRPHIIPKANLTEKPAKHALTAGETAIGLLSMFAVILGPSGWILANLQEYKKR